MSICSQTLETSLKLFFELILVALGKRTALSSAPSADEWGVLFGLSRQQALAGVLWTGVNRLPEDQRPPRDILLSWYALSLKIRELNLRLNKECVEVGNFLNDQGFDCALLKGQSMARLYRHPLSRTPGDIDVWLRPKGSKSISLSQARRAVLSLARQRGRLEGVTYCHVHFPLLKQTEVELHFTPSWMSSFQDNRFLQRFWLEEAPVQFAHAIALPETSGTVASPTNEFNRFYILLHIYRHFFGEGIGLRQLMDFHYVLLQPCSEASRLRTVDMLRRMKMLRFSAAVMFIMQEVFGLSSEQLLLPPNEPEGRFLLSEILHSGNFGKYARLERLSPQNDHAILRFARSIRRNSRFFKHYPHEVFHDPIFRLWLYFWRKWHGWT